MRAAIEMAWEHDAAEFQSRVDKSTAQASGDDKRARRVVKIAKVAASIN
jgi:hypothetical protein